MARRLAACFGLLAWFISAVAGMGVPFDNDHVERSAEAQNESDPIIPDAREVVGNSAYSILGFLLGGSLIFITLFDPTRKPVIHFFDRLFGSKVNRRRREAGSGLEAHVAAAFDTFAAAVDKMEMIARLSQK